MKKLIIAAILMTGMASFAQDQKALVKRENMESMTPAQRNERLLKKMTDELGLNATQQKEMGTLIADQTAKHEAAKAERQKMMESGTKPTSDQRLAMKKKRLDDQIAMNERVKKILTPEQYQKWEKMKEKMHDKRKDGAKQHRMKREEKK